ncbi:MAG: HAD family phosphatase [Fibrobacteria bacterium]|nr:HAD family phosphatase [Fibrobacteria bacterium]
MKKLYISDLDGTLLTSKTTLSKKSREGLQELLAEGMPFTVNTLRSLMSIKPLLSGLPLTIPVIGLNGALILDYATGEKLRIFDIDQTKQEELAVFFENQKLYPSYFSLDGDEKLSFGKLANAGIESSYRERIQAKDKRLCRYTSPHEVVGGSWIGITVIDVPHKIRDAAEELNSRFGAYINTSVTESLETPPGYLWLTVSSVRASKKFAIEALKKDFGYKDYTIVAFGDQPSDIPMFEASDISIAVENAHPAVKECADKIIGHHNDDAVIKYLKADWKRQSR